MRIAAYRRNPWVRRGYRLMMEGFRTGHDGRTWAGVAMLTAGVAVQRGRIQRLQRRPVYRADLPVDGSMKIRVRYSGDVVSEVEIPATES